jgi:gas vesicle protein
MSRGNKGEGLLMMLAGATIGAAIALLFAPQTGQKTRKQIVRYGKKAGGRAQEFVSEIAESIDDVLGDVMELGEEGIVKGKAEILDVLDAGKKYIEDEKAKIAKILK